MNFTFMVTVPLLLSRIEDERSIVAGNNYPRMQAAISLTQELKVPATTECIRALEKVVEAELSSHAAKWQRLIDDITEIYEQAESPVSIDFGDFDNFKLMELTRIWQILFLFHRETHTNCTL
ncbi:hypothetical protein NM688_g4959 [Phlebia brevispora]|uniref:Uncharacterized protein n=1 Tax=Phlebia brevispora TaxID=194682 RepID=A0ACC1T1M1_9APHY|nr:hypothetical protein NM688_g4959 [Phlebia brevispora]